MCTKKEKTEKKKTASNKQEDRTNKQASRQREKREEQGPVKSGERMQSMMLKDNDCVMFSRPFHVCLYVSDSQQNMKFV